MDRVKLKEWIRNNKLTIIVVILFVVSLLIYYSSAFKNPSIENSEINVPTKEENTEEPTAETAKTIIVHISGEVVKPGIIELDYGQRLYEAIDIAGGPTEKADVEQVNLAMILEDQQKVVIPSTDNMAQGNPSVQYSGGGGEGVKININTADKTQLMELPRIGDVTAEAIIQYREENQGFKKIEDIKNVPRIGDVTFEGIKDMITCY